VSLPTPTIYASFKIVLLVLLVQSGFDVTFVSCLLSTLSSFCFLHAVVMAFLQPSIFPILVFLFLHRVICISPIYIKGSKFYDTNGNQFFIKGKQAPTAILLRFRYIKCLTSLSGIIYSDGDQPVGIDILANPAQCKLDVCHSA
jgi:hypothetical protein